MRAKAERRVLGTVNLTANYVVPGGVTMGGSRPRLFRQLESWSARFGRLHFARYLHESCSTSSFTDEDDPRARSSRIDRASRTRSWLALGWGCRGRRLSVGRRLSILPGDDGCLRSFQGARRCCRSSELETPDAVRQAMGEADRSIASAHWSTEPALYRTKSHAQG